MMGAWENESAAAAREEWVRSNLEEEIERLQSLIPQVNYIATYRAECVDGTSVNANMAMSGVAEGATPDSLIQVITEQAFTDMALSGRNASHVVVLNLSRVW